MSDTLTMNMQDYYYLLGRLCDTPERQQQAAQAITKEWLEFDDPENPLRGALQTLDEKSYAQTHTVGKMGLELGFIERACVFVAEAKQDVDQFRNTMTELTEIAAAELEIRNKIVTEKQRIAINDNAPSILEKTAEAEQRGLYSDMVIAGYEAVTGITHAFFRKNAKRKMN